MALLPDPLPARFWVRYAAWSLDAVCLFPGIAILGGAPLRAAWAQCTTSLQQLTADMSRLLDAALAQGQAPTAMALAWLSDPHLLASIDQLQSALFTLALLPPALYAVLACAWSLGFEASRGQATPGKRALGLQVIRMDGQAMTVGIVLRRFLAAGLSWLTLNLGHAMAAFAPYLALHDRLSHTRVVAASPGLPAWAKLWLGMQAAAFLLACLWLFQWLQALMQASMSAALGGL